MEPLPCPARDRARRAVVQSILSFRRSGNPQEHVRERGGGAGRSCPSLRPDTGLALPPKRRRWEDRARGRSGLWAACPGRGLCPARTGPTTASDVGVVCASVVCLAQGVRHCGTRGQAPPAKPSPAGGEVAGHRPHARPGHRAQGTRGRTHGRAGAHGRPPTLGTAGPKERGRRARVPWGRVQEVFSGHDGVRE